MMVSLKQAPPEEVEPKSTSLLFLDDEKKYIAGGFSLSCIESMTFFRLVDSMTGSTGPNISSCTIGSMSLMLSMVVGDISGLLIELSAEDDRARLVDELVQLAELRIVDDPSVIRALLRILPV